jgi:cytochrome c
MTGPSLANLWGHKAGSLPSFDRYSDALKSSGIIWDDRALDGWLTDPQRMVPDNEMPFEGINDALVRADLLAFLKDATKSPCIVGNSIRLASEVESGDALG